MLTPPETKRADLIPVQLSKTCCDWWTILCKKNGSTMKDSQNSATQPDMEIQKDLLPGRTSFVIVCTCVILVLACQIVVPPMQQDFVATSSSTTPNQSMSPLSNLSMVPFPNTSGTARLSSLVCGGNFSREENGCTLEPEVRGNFSSCSHVARHMCGSEATGIGEAVVHRDHEILCKWRCYRKRRRLQKREAAACRVQTKPRRAACKSSCTQSWRNGGWFLECRKFCKYN